MALSHCAGEKIEELTFRINPDLLESEIVDIDLGFVFSPPKGCLPLPDSLVTAVREKVVLSDSFPVDPKHIFFSTEDQFLCLASTLPGLSGGHGELTAYQDAIGEKWKHHQINRASFRYGDYLIHQTRVVSAEQVIYKLVIPAGNGEYFQIDYILPRRRLPEKIEAIESSIGSLKKITTP
jgi:hypothetical protein